MVILGIDPGTTRIGYGLIEKTNNKLFCLDYGVIENPGKDKETDYKSTFTRLSALISKYSPDISALEQIYFFKNQKTIISVSEMRGVLRYALAHHGVPVREFTPLQVKQAVSSYGRADKDQVQRMVRLILNIKPVIRPDDAADGLAIAICCANNIIANIK